VIEKIVDLVGVGAVRNLLDEAGPTWASTLQQYLAEETRRPSPLGEHLNLGSGP
jgi:hypothetical protein